MGGLFRPLMRNRWLYTFARALEHNATFWDEVERIAQLPELQTCDGMEMTAQLGTSLFTPNLALALFSACFAARHSEVEQRRRGTVVKTAAGAVSRGASKLAVECLRR